MREPPAQDGVHSGQLRWCQTRLEIAVRCVVTSHTHHPRHSISSAWTGPYACLPKRPTCIMCPDEVTVLKVVTVSQASLLLGVPRTHTRCPGVQSITSRGMSIHCLLDYDACCGLTGPSINGSVHGWRMPLGCSYLLSGTRAYRTSTALLRARRFNQSITRLYPQRSFHGPQRVGHGCTFFVSNVCSSSMRLRLQKTGMRHSACSEPLSDTRELPSWLYDIWSHCHQANTPEWHVRCANTTLRFSSEALSFSDDASLNADTTHCACQQRPRLSQSSSSSSWRVLAVKSSAQSRKPSCA